MRRAGTWQTRRSIARPRWSRRKAAFTSLELSRRGGAIYKPHNTVERPVTASQFCNALHYLWSSAGARASDMPICEHPPPQKSPQFDDTLPRCDSKLLKLLAPRLDSVPLAASLASRGATGGQRE